nr:hypothetical protein [Tanacetum cinerariifolium]
AFTPNVIRDGTKRFREVLRHSWILSMRKREYPVMSLEPEEEYKELEVVLKRMGACEWSYSCVSASLRIS